MPPPLRTLFDSGAANSILSLPALKKLQSSGNDYVLQPCDATSPSFSLANGSIVCPTGWTYIDLHLNNRPWAQKVYVLEESNLIFSLASTLCPALAL